MKRNIVNKLCAVVLFFLVTYLFCYVTFFKNGFILNTASDWLTQHIQFVDYFRKMFYEEKILIPQFSFNLGSGQNIFYMAYYGIMNPLIMFSYFLPKVPIYIYMQALGFSIIMFTGLLTYIWLRRNRYSRINSLISGLYIMFANGFVFHSFDNYMFGSYLPFLVITFIGIDLYFEKNIKSLIVLGVASCIFISYVFAPAYSIAIVIYAIYKYISMNEESTFKNFTLSGMKFVLIYIVGVLLSSIMLIPTALATIKGRLPNGTTYNIIKTMIPKLRLETIIYSVNGPGLTIVCLFVIFINLFYTKNKSIKIIAWFLFLCISSSFFRVFLNGFMYDFSKVLIPYLLFVALLCAYTLDNIKKYLSKDILVTLFGLCIIVLSLMTNISKYTAIDLLITVVSIYCIHKFNNKFMKFVPIVFIALIYLNTYKYIGNYPLAKTTYSQITKNKKSNFFIEKILKKDKSFYRVNDFTSDEYNMNKIQNTKFFSTSYYSSLINKNGKTFYNNIMNITHKVSQNSILITENNSMFYTYMGIKYIELPNNIEEPIGYKKVTNNNDITLFKNKNVFPLGYATNETYNYSDFNKMDYPEKQEVLLKYAVTKDSNNLKNDSDLEKVNLSGHMISNPKYVDIKKQDNKFEINTVQNEKITYKLDEKIENKLLFINFDIEGEVPEGDRLSITINGSKNVLSSPKYMYYNNNRHFQYVLSSNESIDKLDIEFDEGNYKIRNLRFNTLDYSVVENANKNIDKFNVDRKSVTSRGLKGNIKVRKAGWFVLTIPYDKGFTMKVDGKPVSYEKINGGLMGFKIKGGYHNIQLNYIAPGFRMGQVVSGIALIIFIIIFIHDLYIIRKRRS